MTAVLGVIAAAEPGVDELALTLAGTSRFSLPIGGLPLVVRALRALRAAGAGEILVITSRRSDGDIRELLHAHDDGSLSFAVVDPTGGTGASLGPAVARADGRPLLVHAGDGFLTGRLPMTLEGFDAVAAGRPDVPVLLLGPDAARTAADLDAADLGRLADELERGGARVSRRRAVAGWQYRADVETLLDGNRLALDELPGGAPEGHLEDARIEGRVAIHPTAIVERSRVRGPAWICRGAVITDAFVGPYSMIGDRVELEGAEIEHSLVLSGASIRHLDRRLEESIVGRGATVRRQFSLPASIRMRVGAGAEVLLA